ncbi:hypothetical protein [Thermus tengchongensis]|uniref:hypothetical protein n=1 Tax=Thermus tengchongensis TaxID=1214928 RepID=UPI001F2B2046|nr:hypothetical protein [Thermus tengchongensis]
MAAFLGDVERARSCTPPFALAVSPPDGEYREVLLVAYADGLPFQEGRVVARSGESRTVPLARKRVRVELTAPGFTADVQAVGEVWLRGEDQEGVALYGDPPPPGYEGYRLADRAVVVNGVAELSAPRGGWSSSGWWGTAPRRGWWTSWTATGGWSCREGVGLPPRDGGPRPPRGLVPPSLGGPGGPALPPRPLPLLRALFRGRVGVYYGGRSWAWPGPWCGGWAAPTPLWPTWPWRWRRTASSEGRRKAMASW